MNDTSADVPDEWDVRETRDEQAAPEARDESSHEAMDENTPEATDEYTGSHEAMDEDVPEVTAQNTGSHEAMDEDAPEVTDEYTGSHEAMAPREVTPGTGTAQIPQQASGIPTTAAAMGSGEADADVGGPLLTEAEEFRSSWQQILVGFVDDPRGSVAQAATMVEETASTLIATIQERERVLRSAWEGNDATADTEKLRIALSKYRTFFETITRP